MNEPAAPAADGARDDARVIALVSGGHFFSHFFMLLLPPLFPLLRDVYGVGYTELGFAITLFSLASGLTQTPIGFLVDRYGAKNLLIAALLLESLAFMLIGALPFYGALLALMLVAGVANAVYHPADYTILNAAVRPARMGRGFSVHTFSGYLGNALAPLTILALAGFLGWQQALALCGLAGAATALLLALQGARLDVAEPARHRAAAAGAGGGSLAVLFSAPVLMGLLFFTGLSMAGHGFSDFGVASLTALYPISLERAGLILSAYLFAAPIGVLLGGALADRVTRHGLVAALCLLTIAAAMLAAAALPLGVAGLAALFALAGLANGVIAPSRDMMIRAVTPPGQTGKVFGFVSTGFNIGGVFAPLLFGYFLDHSGPKSIFWAVALISLITVVTLWPVSGHKNCVAKNV